MADKGGRSGGKKIQMVWDIFWRKKNIQVLVMEGMYKESERNEEQLFYIVFYY